MRWFQSTHPRGVRPPAAWKWPRISWFQSTHPRGVRRAGHGAKQRGRCVSIHAPAWGATPLAVANLATRAMFQSTHPRGVRPHDLRDARQRRIVSIHAPAWGATSNLSSPATPRLFQSTHPRGVRRRPREKGPPPGRSFNPRTRVGCDVTFSTVFEPALAVSIHAPAWGATDRGQQGHARRHGFNPRTRVGCDCFHVLSSRFP